MSIRDDLLIKTQAQLSFTMSQLGKNPGCVRLENDMGEECGRRQISSDAYYRVRRKLYTPLVAMFKPESLWFFEESGVRDAICRAVADRANKGKPK
jgi:hypothetical protein